jgi:CubicO group peptidase (beta-lactamase class C family)
LTNPPLIPPRFTLLKSGKYCVAVLLLALAFSTPALTAQPSALKRGSPASVAVSAERLAAIDDEVESEIKQHHLPGAVVLVARKGHVVWRKAYGARAVEPTREAMTTDTIFDLASLTKVVATATSIMILVERGEI